MTKRDMLWRGAGALISVTAGAGSLTTDSAPLVVVLFLAILFGLTLMINGKRVIVVLRAERRGHCHTAEVIHAKRVRPQHRDADGAR